MKHIFTFFLLIVAAVSVSAQENRTHKGEMKDGKYVGKQVWYYAGGNMEAEVTYDAEGSWTRVRTWDEAGNLIDDEYAPKGRKKKMLPELDFSFEEDGFGFVLLPQNRSEDEPFPSLEDKVYIRYEGYLQDGTVFDGNLKGKPLKFRLGRQEVIEGFERATAMLKVGDTGYFYVPWHMAYSNMMVGTIPPYSNLIFQVTLEDLNSAGKR